MGLKCPSLSYDRNMLCQQATYEERLEYLYDGDDACEQGMHSWYVVRFAIFLFVRCDIGTYCGTC